MSSNHIDRNAVYKFVTLVHERARAAIAGTGDAQRPVLHLCSAAPDDARFFHSAYNIGDIGRMADDALIDSAAGKNVFIEPRLVRPGLPGERGRLEATLAVFACVADSDADAGKPFAAPVPASAVVETSPQNEHSWFFLRRAIGAGDAQALGKLMRQSSGGDGCSGNCVQPFRCAGTINYPNRKKSERGRVVTPTRIQRLTGVTYTIDELRAAFQPCDVPHQESPNAMPAAAFHSRGYSRSMAKAILAAEPGADRSARFMAAASHAARGGLTADEFESLARQFPGGCVEKYLEHGDRLRAEIDRCFSKIATSAACEYKQP